MELFGMPLHDAQENVSEDGWARNTMDAINRVVQAETFDENIQINRYDAEGLRAEMEENGRISKFVFDGKNVVAEETDGDVIRYIRGDRILASDSEHARTYYHYVGDELGSVTHVTDENGIVLNRYAYDAFGKRTVCEEKIANRFGYAGEMYDGVTQQYYLRARFYNPIIGRFTQEDTYYGDGLNLYEYGRNNPVRYIDPSGHEVRAAAEKNYVNRAVDAMNKAADQGVNGMLERVYGGNDGEGGYSTINKLSAEEVNRIFRDTMGYEPPYKPGTTVTEIQLKDYKTYVRVYDNVNSRMQGGWIMEENDIVGLTPAEIQNKFALPSIPQYICDVVLEPGTYLRCGEVNPLFGFDGGGKQYDLIINGKNVGTFINERIIIDNENN